MMDNDNDNGVVYAEEGKPADTAAAGAATGEKKKPTIVILGSGWAALNMVKELDTELYDVVVVSPRNYFLFTPLLPSVTVGTLDAKTIIEPIRKYCQRTKSHIKYYEASCTDIDPDKQVVVCKDPHAIHGSVDTFEVPYDYLVVAVGAVNNTFGTPGVYENCYFLKEIQDALNIKSRIIDCFETANLPGQTEEERKRLLHFVVVGGGPNGIEFAAELNDYLAEDLRKWFPHLIPEVKITVVELMDHILNTYDKKISEYCEKHFTRENIELLVNTMVTGVTDKAVLVKPKGAKKEDPPSQVPFGLCVWSTGIGPSPLVNTIREKIGVDVQSNRRALLTDRFLRVQGKSNIYAMGDCATINQDRMLEKFVELFRDFDTNRDGVLSLDEFKNLVNTEVKKYPQLEEVASRVEQYFYEADPTRRGYVNIDEFKEILKRVDSKLTILPATAQVASQQGYYLAHAFNDMARGGQPTYFQYRHFGSFAYVGSDKAVAELPRKIVVNGLGAFWLWRSVYLSKQVSWKNKYLVATNWAKTRVFGRDITRN